MGVLAIIFQYLKRFSPHKAQHEKTRGKVYKLQ